jgi:hypothetical protein
MSLPSNRDKDEGSCLLDSLAASFHLSFGKLASGKQKFVEAPAKERQKLQFT